MKSFIPQNTATNQFEVLPIDIATTTELVKYFDLLSGMATMLFDGVMVNRKSKVRQCSLSLCDFVHENDLLS